MHVTQKLFIWLSVIEDGYDTYQVYNARVEKFFFLLKKNIAPDVPVLAAVVVYF